jgi:hypothetical protein
MKFSFLIMLTGALSAYCAMPYTFDSGTVAKASQVNANMLFLMNKIDSINTKFDSLTKIVDLQKTTITTLTGNIESLKTTNTEILSDVSDSLKKQNMPVGTIIGTMTAMDTSGDIWVIADGRTATTEYFNATGKANIPDLRGQFLRGLNAGRTDSMADPDGGSRTAGSYQADAFQGHTHYTPVQHAVGTGGGAGYSVAWDSRLDWATTYPNSPPQADNTNGTPRIASETRPCNTAIYWYIKVK